MTNKKTILMALTAASLAAVGMGCNGTDQAQSAKPAADANWVQCGGTQTEVLMDVTASQLEQGMIMQGPVYTRDITNADSEYVPLTIDTIPASFTDSAQPGVHGFSLINKENTAITLETTDFKTGTMVYTPGENAEDQTLTSCSFDLTRPGKLPVPPSSNPNPTPEPTPTPTPVPTPTPTPAGTGYYLDCTGQTYEVYMDFSHADAVSWVGMDAGNMGSRLVSTPTANFTFYGSLGGSAYSLSGTNYVSFGGTDSAGNQFNVNVSATNLSSAAATVSTTSAGGQNGSDTLSCSWETSNIYAGKYGW